MIQELLIVDVVDIDSELQLPISIADGVEFDRVSPSKVGLAKAWLDRYLTGSSKSGSELRFESVWVPDSAGGHSAELSTPRYFCFRSQLDNTETIAGLIDVVHLLPIEMVPGCALVAGDFAGTIGGPLFNPQRLQNSGGAFGLASNSLGFRPGPIPSIGRAEIDGLTALLADRMRLKDCHEPLVRAIRCLRESDLVHRASALWMLAHFTAIEAALTHSPHAGDPVDSIKRQIQMAAPLLLRRAQDAPRPESLGVEGEWRNVLNQLYDLRSQIAHGSLSRGDKVGHSRLPKDWDSIEALLRELTKAVLRQCLREPDLAIDLKGKPR